ncbi:L-isoaspartyl protein carboxyl methyltransferase family protein [Toxoplasma gondii MAS]|uniref:protein-L-isoaspartate(D-aspartate) O-methyltransferase n=1 Tax=Toxoplasma gondii MAS TaxID=943118 RepID=A0A086R0H2_TOXGO|nr:L-isoaspartyl protein carboxyl methyltransferase family protein [Toxoplasma gondii MAS]
MVQPLPPGKKCVCPPFRILRRVATVSLLAAFSSGVCTPHAGVSQLCRQAVLENLTSISYFFRVLSSASRLQSKGTTSCSLSPFALAQNPELRPSDHTRLPSSSLACASGGSVDCRAFSLKKAHLKTGLFAVRTRLFRSPLLRHLLQPSLVSFLSSPANFQRFLSVAERPGTPSAYTRQSADRREPRKTEREPAATSASLPLHLPSRAPRRFAPVLLPATSIVSQQERGENRDETREERSEAGEKGEESKLDADAEESDNEEEISASEAREKRGIMAWRCSGASNDELVDNLRASGIVRDHRVYDAMKSIDRGNFIDVCPYADMPQPLGISSATISAPHMHASALEALKDHLVPGNRVLDVGSGSGYLTACMAHMVGVRGAGKAEDANTPEGVAVGIDYLPDLVKYSVKKVKAAYPALSKNPRFKLLVGDGWRGHPELGPYDAIHVGAAASSIPRELLAQLAHGGKMVLPVETTSDGQVVFEGPEEETERQLSRGRGWWSDRNQVFVEVSKDAQGKVRVKKLMGVMYVPLVKQSSSRGER